MISPLTLMMVYGQPSNKCAKSQIT